MYRCVTGSIAGFIQQIASVYAPRGYYFYVDGHIPETKDPVPIDRKLVDRYGLDISKWARARRRRRGVAGVQYLRCGRRFVLLATAGDHEFRRGEAGCVQDMRRVPLKVFGYSVTVRSGQAVVRIAEGEFRRLRSRLLDNALRRGLVSLTEEFGRIPFEPYRAVRKQLISILRAVNRKRRRAGLRTIDTEVVRARRWLGSPFIHAPLERDSA